MRPPSHVVPAILAPAIFVVLALVLAALPARAAPPQDLVQAELVSETPSVQPGGEVTLGIRMRMKPGWHTYWLNPGDSGLPTEIAWRLPPGFSAGAVRWPAPERIPVADFMNFGYEGEILPLVPLRAAADATIGGTLPVEATLSYLVCERECIPGKATIRTRLTVAGPGSASATAGHRDAFEAARARIPAPLPWPSRLASEGDRLVLGIDAPELQPGSIRSAAFFPYDPAAIDHAAPQDLTVADGRLALRLKPAGAGSAPEALAGVLTLTDTAGGGGSTRAFTLGDAPAPSQPTAAASVQPNAVPAVPNPEIASLPLWQAALLAFLGGLVLNLMPCVFPVLSIKVLALVRHSGEPMARVRGHGLAYAAGVLTAFLAVAGTLIALRAGGARIGWGYQLQSPVVVAGLAFLLLATGLNLSGVFHVGGSVAGIGDRLTRRAGFEGSFFTGALAAIVATPCTAPFMGAAVGFALTQPAGIGLAVFAALALGLAAPFVLLTNWPGLMRRLPRPGPWMAVLKGLLAFPVYGTVAWLVWVVSRQVGAAGLMATLAGLVLVAFAAWALGQSEGAGGRGRRIGVVAAALAILALGVPAALIDGDRAAPARTAGADAFTEARLAALRSEGRPVFVNLTAAWCITCLVNERTALDTDAVRSAMRQRDVAVLTGDWTNQDAAITQVLERHGRSGVPLYLLYVPGQEAIVLPQILTESRVLSELERLPARKGGLTAQVGR